MPNRRRASIRLVWKSNLKRILIFAILIHFFGPSKHLPPWNVSAAKNCYGQPFQAILFADSSLFSTLSFAREIAVIIAQSEWCFTWFALHEPASSKPPVDLIRTRLLLTVRILRLNDSNWISKAWPTTPFVNVRVRSFSSKISPQLNEKVH